MHAVDNDLQGIARHSSRDMSNRKQHVHLHGLACPVGC